LVTSYNMSGSRVATALALQGDALLVGADLHASYKEFHVFTVRSSGAIVYRGGLDTAASINAIAVTGSAALLATGDSAAELKQVNITNAYAPAYPSSSDFNLTSTEAGRAVAAAGTSALLGRTKGSIQELVMLNPRLGGGSPPPSPGPWYHESSGSVIGLAMDPVRCYAFVADDSSIKAFQVVQQSTSLPELATYNSTSGPARGIFYDPVRDRVFLLTRGAVLIFKPASPPGPCSS
jgi:hypothetical protein